jgi:hypothetical protein
MKERLMYLVGFVVLAGAACSGVAVGFWLFGHGGPYLFG